MTRTTRALRALSTVLIVSGTIILADAILTVVWQEPVTAALAQLRQGQLDDELQELRAGGLTPIERKALQSLEGDRRRLAFLARSLKRRTEDGDAVGRLRIPSIGLDKVVVDGSDPEDLRKGPGFYDQTPLPGVRGTTAIAGHRTTYGAPFRDLDDVEPRDRITVELPYATFTYRVRRSRIVEPDALWVLDRRRTDQLVLSACHPLFSAAQRIVVFADLERVVPASAGSAWTTVAKLERRPQAPRKAAR